MNNLIILLMLAAVLTVSMGNKISFLPRSDFSKNKTFTTQRTVHSSSSSHLAANEKSNPSMVPPLFNLEFVSEIPIPEAFPGPPVPRGNLFYFDFEAPIKTMMSFCPSFTSCQKKNVAHITNIGNECCLPCDCSNRCYFTGTCCVEMSKGSRYPPPPPPPAHPRQPVSIVTETCVNSFITGSKFNSYPRYLLIQQCSDSTDYRMIRKCLDPKDFKLEEMTPVFSHKTNRHYRNVFCARCNNDTHKLVTWQTVLSCNSSHILTTGFPQEMSSISSVLKFISTHPHCELVVEPPSNARKVERCFSEEGSIVSHCNNPFLDDLCKQYYAPVKAGNIIYRNVFCMECAYPSDLSGFYKICYPLHVDLPHPVRSVLSLNIDQKKALIYRKPNYKICPYPKMFHDELTSCVHHTCAVTEINLSGTCQPIFSKLIKIHLEYRLKMLYRVFTLDILDTLKSMDINILAAVGTTRDNICFADVLSVKVSSQFTEISVAYIKLVEATNIRQSYNEFEDRIEAYNKMARTKNNMFLLQIDKSGVEPMLENSVTFLKFTTSNFTHYCINSIAMSKLQFCDTITFHEDEFKIHDSGTVSIGNLMFVPGEYIIRRTLNGTIKYLQVCMDDYISTYKLKNVTSAADHVEKTRNKIWFLLCLISVLQELEIIR